MVSRSTSLRIAATIILLLVAAISLALFHLDPERSPRAAAEWLREVGHHWWAPLAYVALYALFALLLIPPLPLSITAALTWGWFVGGLWELAGASLGAILPYLLARQIARDRVARRIEQRFQRAAEMLRREGFSAILLVRLVPVVPYVVLNYLAGAVGIRPPDYSVATLFGMIPSIFIFTFLVDSIVAGMISPGDAFLRVMFAGSLFAALYLATRWLARRKLSRADGP